MQMDDSRLRGGGKASAAKKPQTAAQVRGRRIAEETRKSNIQFDKDMARGINPNKRSASTADRRTKRAMAVRNTKAGKPSVSTAKGLAVKPKGPLAGVRRAAFKAVAKVQRAVRGKDARGKKLPRWAA